jgi:hypothetical protein
MSHHLQSVDQMFAKVVTESMDAAVLTDADAAAVLLAKRYARAIDQAEDRDAALKDYGPKLLAVLAQLRCTPAARGAAKPAPTKGGRLAALRDARAAG